MVDNRSLSPFGELMRSHRKRLGLSQNDIRDKTGLDRTYISTLENRGNPSFNVIKKIADAMGMTLAEFFQTSPVEAKPPAVVVDNAALANYKSAELLIKTAGWPVPILRSDIPLRTKIIEESHIAGYMVVDQALVPEVKDRRTAIWPVRDSKAGARFCLVDINDTNLQNGQMYLVDLEGIQIRKAYIDPRGALIFEGATPDEVEPIAFWGRVIKTIAVLGRVILCGVDFADPGRT